FAARGDLPGVDDLAVADDLHLVLEVDRRAYVVRDDFHPITDIEPFFTGRKLANAVLLAELGDDDIRMADDVAVARMRLARVHRQRLRASVEHRAILRRAADDRRDETGGAVINAPVRPVPEEGVVVEDVCPGTGLGDALDERRKAGRGRRSDADGRKLDPVLADLLRRFHHLLASLPR